MRNSKKVLYAINEAGKIAQNTIREYLKNHPTFDENQGYWGWAYICTNVVSDITQALQNINCSRTYSDGIYRLNVNNYQTSNVELLKLELKQQHVICLQNWGNIFM